MAPLSIKYIKTLKVKEMDKSTYLHGSTKELRWVEGWKLLKTTLTFFSRNLLSCTNDCNSKADEKISAWLSLLNRW